MRGSIKAGRPRSSPLPPHQPDVSGHDPKKWEPVFRKDHAQTMKVATFNINNINRRLPNLVRWLRAAKPDIVSLQELKSSDEDFPVSAINKAGYGAVWRGQKAWNGVAILARNTDPVLVRTELP